VLWAGGTTGGEFDALGFGTGVSSSNDAKIYSKQCIETNKEDAQMMPKLKGSHPWALILCYPSDQTAPAWPGISYFNDLINSPTANGLYAWWQQMSGGRLDLSGSAVLGWYGLSNTLAQVNRMDRGRLVDTARAAATAARVDLSKYGHTLACVVGYAGGGNVGADVAWSTRATNGQPGWRWCANCEGLAFWDGSRSPGPCIAGGHHDHGGSGYYSLPHDTSFSNGQPGWSWCNKCEALSYNTANPAPCPGGGAHSFGGSANYVLRANSTADNEQQHWKWCRRCQALAFFDGSRQPGPCPLGGRHDHTTSADYSIPIAWAADMGWLGHECGHGFGLIHSFGTKP